MTPPPGDVRRIINIMNTPNPLVPQGSQLEQKSNARSRVKLAVFFVLTIHVVGLVALLVQGCRPEAPTNDEILEPPPQVPAIEPIAVPPAETNPALLPPIEDMPPETATPESVYAPPGTPSATPLPSKPADVVMPMGQEYAVKKGDTYYSIGKQFGVSMQALKEANPGVEPTRLQVGQKIMIPAPKPAVTETVVPTASGEIIYTVVSGDTLTRIASKYGTTWQAILELNNLPTTKITVGQKLRIPAPAPPAGGTSDGGM